MGSGSSDGTLDDLVTYTELTLIAIVQGIALFVLVEAADGILESKEWLLVPYVVVGLLVVVLFWALAIFHTFTIIGWPFDLGHNMLYILATLLQSLMYAELKRPATSWLLFTVFLGVIWALFVYDLKLLHARRIARPDDAHAALFAVVEKEQRRQIRFVYPVLFSLSAAAAASMHFLPGLMLGEGWHAALASVTAIGLCGYVWFVVHLFRVVSPLVTLAKRGSQAG
jgi:hypothetical protein